MWSFLFEHVVLYWTVSLLGFKHNQLNTTSVLRILINQLFITPWFLTYMLRVKKKDKENRYKVVWWFLSQNVLFYFAHRLFHQGVLFKYIHRVHHAWITPEGWTAFDCHPMEHAIVNLLPVFCGPWIMPLTLSTSRWYFHLATVYSIITHAIQGSHQLHHALFNVHYGTNDWMDYLCQTQEIL